MPSTKKNKIIIAGSVAFDSIKTHAASAKNVIGGSASYASIAASYFAAPKLIAAVGADFTHKYIAPFKKRGIDLSGLQIKNGKTFEWGASYDKDFKNATTLYTRLNVFAGFEPMLAPGDAGIKTVFLANIAPALQMSVLNQMKSPALIACDTMNFWIQHNRAELARLLKKVHILFVNEAETRQLTGTYNLIKAGRQILKAGPQVVIIKLGPNGAILITKDFMCHLPPYLIDSPADTTGAGDSFGGGFTGYLAAAKNWRDMKTLKRAMAVGTVMASFAIESFSITRLAGLSKQQIDKRLADYINTMKI